MKLHCLCPDQHTVFHKKKPFLPLSSSPPGTQKGQAAVLFFMTLFILNVTDSPFTLTYIYRLLLSPIYLCSLLVSPHTAKCLPKQSAVRANKICQHMICSTEQGCDEN